MATYKDLADSFRAYEDAKDRHYLALQQEADVLVKAFIEKLALERPSWKNQLGRERPYVSAGKLEDGKFIEMDSRSLPIDPETRGIRFAISVALERSFDTAQKTHAIVEVSLVKRDAGFLVTVLPDGAPMRVPALAQDRFDQVVEAIGQKIISMYDPAEFPGPEVYR